FTAYHDALPILGVDGSLAHNVPPDSPARGKVHAKTGTIVTGDLLNLRPLLLVKGLAGYMTAASGRKLAFAVYVNNVPLKELNDIVQVGNDLGTLAETIYIAE
ncbi:MAG: peptidase S13, partial [Planctomycetaceae bacterium]